MFPSRFFLPNPFSNKTQISVCFTQENCQVPPKQTRKKTRTGKKLGPAKDKTKKRESSGTRKTRQKKTLKIPSLKKFHKKKVKKENSEVYLTKNTQMTIKIRAG